MSDTKFILYDMDGVLVDACEWHYLALNKALEKFGETISRHDHQTRYDGLPTKKKLTMMTADRGFPVEHYDEVFRLKQVYTKEFTDQYCKPIPHIVGALERLKRDGYRMAVCSNSIHETVELMLTRSGIIGYFEFFLSNRDAAKPKPDPEIYQKAMARLGAKPNECLIVEDNAHGLEAARRAGGHILKITAISELNYGNLRARLDSIAIEKAAA